MGEVIKFPINPRPTPAPTSAPILEVINENVDNSAEVFEFRKKAELGKKEGNIKACLFEGAPQVAIGGEIVLEVCGKRYKGIVVDIVQRDENNNITKIAYNIPFLNGDDPLKFGEADFTYKTETYD